MSMTWTQEQLDEYYARRNAERGALAQAIQTVATPPVVIGSSKRSMRSMNKLESAYAQVLNAEKLTGVIDWWEFEWIRLRLADGAWFKPDFAVLKDGRLEFRETKGFWREAARVRIRVAADRFPFRFVAVTHKGGAWTYEEFSA